MNLDELMDRGTQPVAAPDTVDDAMDAYSGAQTGAVRAGATLALDSNPDEIARQKRIAQSLGVPLAAVEADPEFATREQRVRSIEQATASSPALRQKFSEADFARLAADDVDNLSGIEQLIRSAKRGFTAGLRGWDAGEIDTAAQGLNRLNNMGPARNEPLRPQRNITQADAATLDGFRGQYSRLLSDNAVDFTRRTGELKGLEATGATKGFYEAQGWGDSFSALLSDPFEISANVATESLGLMAPSMPAIVAGGLAGGPAGLAGAVGATSYQAEYGGAIAEELQKSGVNLEDIEAVRAFVATPEFSEVRRKAQIKAAVIGVFDAATAGMAGVRLRPSMAGNLAAQTGLQAAGGAAGEVAGSVASGQEVNASSVLAEAIGGLPSAVLDVATMAGRQAIQGQRKAEQAEQQSAFIENLNKLATDDKLLQRSPDDFQAFAAEAAKDGPADTVFIDAKTLMQSGMAPRLVEMAPAVREQLDRAILTGGQIAIPTAEYLTRIAPTDIAPQLADHLKFDPDGDTRAEAREWRENFGTELQAEVERMIGNQAGADTFRASQDAVKANILGQLNTVGRFTPQANEAYATLVGAHSAVRAAQMGITPEEFHQRYGMKVQGAAVAGQQFSQAARMDSGALFDWSRGVERKHGLSRFDTYLDGDDIVLGVMTVPQESRSSGRGSAAMQDLIDLADREGRRVRLNPAEADDLPGEGTTSRDRLVQFYKRFGFVENADPDADERMIREPKEAANSMLGGANANPDQPTASGVSVDQSDPNILNQSANGSLYEKAWKMLAGNEAIFQLPLPDSFDMEGAAKEIDPGMSAVEDNPDLDEQKTGITKKWYVKMPDGTHAYVMENQQGEVWLDASRLEEGASGGTKLYLLVGSYAEGNGKVFIGDPAGLSDVALIRRTENMLSLALRFGKTGFMRPHEYQMNPDAKQGTKIAGVVRPINWVEGDDANNIEELIKTSYANTVAIAPDIKNVTYNFDKRAFEQDGREFTDADFATLAAGGDAVRNERNAVDPAGRSIRDGRGNGGEARGVAPVGSATLKRAAVTNTLARETRGGRGGDVLAEIGRFVSGELTGLAGTLYQPDGAGPRGAFSPATNTVTLLQNADLSTFLHESAHYFFESDIRLASELLGKPDLTSGEQQIVDDVGKLLTWHGIQGDVTEQLRQWHTMDFEEQRSHHERTAESFEAYLFSGQAPNLELQVIFQRFRAWMVNVYKSITDFLKKNPEAGKLNDEVRSVFDRMIATQEQIHLAEQARSLTALFASPETSGMTADAYAAYQALDVDATNTAIEELQAKGLRDMQWLTNARGRAVKKLQKESKAVRAEITMEARREVMSQPVYRAWDFLTGKAGEKTEAQTQNELEVEDWNQRRQEAMDAARASAKTEAWDNSDESRQEYDSGRAKGMAKGQLLARQKKDIDLIVARAALDWDRANPRPVADQDSNVFDLGEQVFGKINRAALEDIGVPEEITAHIRNLRMTAADGMHPDQIAEMFEFSSGDEMVRTLAAAPAPKDAINDLAEQMMLERHGELSSPDAIERAADQAIHNDVRARMLATEVNALAKAIGKPKILASAAKAFAADMIARLKIRDIRPGQYANAEARASKAADKAHKAGDTALAASEKRNQIIQHYATRAAYDAQDEVKDGLRYLKKFDKRSKTIDPEYQDQIEAMLERFELRAISNKAVDRRTSLAQWLTAQREAGLEPDIDPKLENEAFRTSYKNITVEEFRGLVDAVKQIEHMGRMKNKLLTAQDQRAFRTIVDEVAGSIIDNGGKARKVELETPKGIRPWLEGVAAGHRKIASLIRQMDGLKDGGPFWRVLVRGMNEASTNETVMIEQATVKLAELYKPMLALKGGLNGDLRSIPEIGDSLTRGGRLSVALNWGNAANRQRVMDGDQWSEQQVHAIMKTLTREEWAFVQNVWTFIDSFWPAIEAKEKRITGRAPDKVAAEPFSYMVDGEMVSLTGGYYPIKYDSNRDDKAEKHDAAAIAQDMMRGAMTRSTTRRGHTKARMESVNRPVKKTLDVITQHVSEVTHDLAWHEWLVDANRLLDAKPINQAIRDYYGTEVLRTMKDALTSIATADIIPQDAIDRGLLYLRANVSRSTMGLSLTTAFLQPFGLLQSMVRIGPKSVMRGMARWAGDAARFESSMTWIGEKSDFMRLRSKTFNRELHEIKGRVNHGHSKARTIYDASLFMLMQKMQMVADVPTWIGAYEKALATGQDDATAVALADQAVLDSQGGGQTKDMAAFQRSHPFLTMFYSYFNTTLNLAAESTAVTNFKNPLAVAGWASDMTLLLVIPALAPAMILALMRGEECGDPEECAAKLARVQAGYLMNLMLGVRELSGITSGYDYSGPPVGRVVTQMERAGTQAAQGEADEAAAMSAISLLGVTLGIPTTQILRSYRGWVAWEDGEAPATSVLMGPPPKD